MGKVVFIVLGLGLAAAAVFVFIGNPFADTDGGDTYYEDEDEETLDAKSAGLTGTGDAANETDEARSLDGEYDVRGVVTDAKGKPIAGMRVTVHAAQADIDYNDPSTWKRNNPRFRLKRDLDRFRSPNPALKLIGETTTDEEGRYSFDGMHTGKYHFRAWPEAPKVSTVYSVTLSSWSRGTAGEILVLDGSRLKGRVLDASDQPVGAALSASWYSKENMGKRWMRTPVMMSDPKTGAFDFDAVPSGSIAFVVTVPGRMRVSGISVETPHEGEFVIRLAEGGGTLHGKVLDTSAAPVVGAEVFISTSQEIKEGETTTSHRLAFIGMSDGSGAYRIEGIPAGKLTSVRILADGYLARSLSVANGRLKETQIKAGAETELDLTVVRGGRVDGRVLKQGTTEGIAAAEVRLYQARSASGGESYPPMIATANSNGRFAFEGVAEGRLIVVAFHAAYYLPQLAQQNNQLMMYVPGGSGGGAPAELTIVMPEKGEAVERNIELAPGRVISGTVLDPEGALVEGAKILSQNFNFAQVAYQWGVNFYSGQMNELAVTDSAGAFTVRSLPQKEGLILYAKKEGYAGAQSAPLAVQEDEELPRLELKLVKGAIVRGVVTRPDDGSTSSVSINVWGQNMHLAGTQPYVQVGPENKFEFKDLPAGTHNLWVNASGYQAKKQQIALTDLKPGEVRDDIEVELIAGVTVSGRLVDKEGKGVPNLSVNLQPIQGGNWSSAMTDKDGYFEFKGAKAGQSQIVIHAPTGQQNIGQKFEAPASGLTIEYSQPKSVTIEGRIFDGAGDPVPLCNVEIKAKGQSSNNQQMYSSGNNQNEVVNGHFRRSLKGEAPFTLKVSAARGRDGLPLNVQPKSVKLDKLPSEPVEIRLEAGLETDGIVKGPDGLPVANVTIQHGTTTVRTGADGLFRLGGLRDGDISIVITPPSPFIKPKNHAAKAGDKGIVITLAKGLSIKGRVVGPEGTAGSGGYVNANWQKSGDRPAGNAASQVSHDGSFNVTGIPEDALVTLTISSAWVDGKQQFAPIIVSDIRPGTDNLELQFEEGVSITGAVRTADGKPFTECWVYAQDEKGHHAGGWSQPKADGTFELTGMQRGNYKILINRRDGGPTSEGIAAVAPSTGIEIVIAEALKMHGKLLGAGTDATKFQVRAWKAGGDPKKASYGKVTGDGSWSITISGKDEKWTVAAMRRGDNRYALAGPFDATAKNIRIELVEGLSIRGRVEQADGSPKPKFWVMATSKTWYRWIKTDANGEFEHVGLIDEAYDLQAGTGQSKSNKEEAVRPGATGVVLRMP